MPNTGLLYTSDDVFNVINIFDGKVSEIINDDFFTKCLVIEHDNNIKSYYYGLDEITVQVGDFVNTGDMLGISRNNEIMNNKKSMLLEVYHNNKLINPEDFIGTKITDYE